MAGPWRTVAEMQLRDLLRRHAALLLLIGMPMSWYAAEEAAAGIDYAVGTGVLARDRSRRYGSPFHLHHGNA